MSPRTWLDTSGTAWAVELVSYQSDEASTPPTRRAYIRFASGQETRVAWCDAGDRLDDLTEEDLRRCFDVSA